MSGPAPDELLDEARACEVGLRLTRRTAALDTLDALLARADVPAPPPGRDWRLELEAERAIDSARLCRIEEAVEQAGAVLDRAADRCEVALARATEARGRALGWTGTDAATREAQRVLERAVDLYRGLGNTEWEGYARFWLGNTVHLQNGRVRLAVTHMRAALAVLAPDSPRRASVCSFLADALTALGRFAEAETVLEEGLSAAADDDEQAHAYLAWTRARLHSARGEARRTERLLAEVERHLGDWFLMHTGSTYLADAAELLDRVGLHDDADVYLARARERDPDDTFVAQAEAVLLARRGEPGRALLALRGLVRGQWLEKRHVWRLTLFEAYALLRAGDPDAGRMAALALRQAEPAEDELPPEQDGADVVDHSVLSRDRLAVAVHGESDLVHTLAPLAEAAGSTSARWLLAPTGLVVRLLGTTRLARGEHELVLPRGQAAELVRLVAVHEHGIATEEVLEIFFADLETSVARHRLRQLLTRIRTSVAELVVRDGERLVLAPSWVDVHAFAAAADRAVRLRGATRPEAARAALALWQGDPLPADTYAAWAVEPRQRLRRRHLALLDIVGADAVERGDGEEALRTLGAAIEEDPYGEHRYLAAVRLLLAAGRRGAAVQLARQAQTALASIGVPAPPELLRLV